MDCNHRKLLVSQPSLICLYPLHPSYPCKLALYLDLFKPFSTGIKGMKGIKSLKLLCLNHNQGLIWLYPRHPRYPCLIRPLFDLFKTIIKPSVFKFGTTKVNQ